MRCSFLKIISMPLKKVSYNLNCVSSWKTSLRNCEYYGYESIAEDCTWLNSEKRSAKNRYMCIYIIPQKYKNLLTLCTGLQNYFFVFLNFPLIFSYLIIFHILQKCLFSSTMMTSVLFPVGIKQTLAYTILLF